MKRFRILTFTLAMSLLNGNIISAAEALPAAISIKGSIKDKNGEAITGGAVRVENTTLDTIADIDGNFTINNIPNDKKLKIAVSFLGYKTVIKEINARSDVDLRDIKIGRAHV